VIFKPPLKRALNFEIGNASQDCFPVAGVAVSAVDVTATIDVAGDDVMIDTVGCTTRGLDLGQRWKMNHLVDGPIYLFRQVSSIIYQSPQLRRCHIWNAKTYRSVIMQKMT
jgi:FlaG/FlaF family flagellin (archaellin)